MFLAVFEKRWWKLPKKSLTGESVIMKDTDERDNEHDQDTLEEVTSDTVDRSYSNFEVVTDPEITSVMTPDTEPDDDSEDDSDTEDEVFSNLSQDIDDNDPLSEAYEFASEEDTLEEAIQRNTRIASPLEFFEKELQHRYEMLDASDREDIYGRYRLEVRGPEGGVWTLNVDKELQVVPEKQDADLILMMHSDDLLSVVNGKINPQIALASRRIKISGNPKKASLFQNLLAPLAE
jgi:hypothetical protein